jgi:hypothetical protein
VDTFTCLFREAPDKKGIENEPFDTLILTNTAKSPLDITQPVVFYLSNPGMSFDTSKFNLRKLVDTLEVNVPFQLTADSINPRKYVLAFENLETFTYKYDIFPGFFTDIYGNSNDSISAMFNSQSLDYYSKISLNIMNDSVPVIIQLINDKDVVLREYNPKEENPIVMEYIKPAKYRFKAIFDINENGKWDTGNYDEKIQPESVKFYKAELDVKSKWERELEWDLGED